MLTHNLGYPRMGARRELKKACERYWAGETGREQLFLTAKKLREAHWTLQQSAGLDFIPCNDFSFYDQVLDMSMLLGVIPNRYAPVVTDVKGNTEIDLYFAMARGYQKDGLDITAMEMTKWYDTNYHYIVPEFQANQQFKIFSTRLFGEVSAATALLGKVARPVLLGPVSYLLSGKEKEAGFNKLDLVKNLVPVYIEILNRLKDDYQVSWVQLDEPCLVTDLDEKAKAALAWTYAQIKRHCPHVKTLLTTYFGSLEENQALALSLPVCALHVDLVRAPQQLDSLLSAITAPMSLSLGVIDGRNIWKNEYDRSLPLIQKAIDALGKDRVMIAPSCSLLHSPADLELETAIDPVIKNRLAFARQKLQELTELRQVIRGNTALLVLNRQAQDAFRRAATVYHKPVQQSVSAITEEMAQRTSSFVVRQEQQQQRFQLPLFPTTTIGSFPQTTDIRQLRAQLKKGALNQEQYDIAIEKATIETIRRQEAIGLDVLVHGEFERNDMVEYFGEQLKGFLFTQYGWVQSYGSRCVKPPVIYGDVYRAGDMTVRWSSFAQAQTAKPMKGMLTGPVTILQWSFVRDDQPRWQTAWQIALAIRDEVLALEQAGIGMIQIDEPAIREGLPLRQRDWQAYLDWAVQAFKISAGGVKDDTQIHTHMCYSEFNDIMPAIAAMDADVITIETSRSQMELLEAFARFQYPNEAGPGVYDIHSPRVPAVEEMVLLLEKAAALLPARNLWVNPDCGLKTRRWPETMAALQNMVQAAVLMRERITLPQPL